MTSSSILRRQHAFFRTGLTLDVGYRRYVLNRLKEGVRAYRRQICAALYEDLGKGEAEAYMCEVAMVFDEINHLQQCLSKETRPKLVIPSVGQFPALCWVERVPYGAALIISPWNYPFLLAIQPLCDALAAGNTAVLKPSEYAPRTAEVLWELIANTLPDGLVTVVTGGQETAQELLSQPFDFVFFTGGTRIGREVLKRSAEHLTPTVLELGGKSPCIVDEAADIARAARCIVFGKLLNSGQTCIAPDYVLVHQSRKEALLRAMEREIHRQFPELLPIVNRRHYERLCGLLASGRVRAGGQRDDMHLRLAPTVLDEVPLDSPVMQEEIFGPVLPVLTWEHWEQALAVLEQHPKPLALYYFSENVLRARQRTRPLQFGGGCINDTMMHLQNCNMPFGGIGPSGMGQYHGRWGIETFSHAKSILESKADMPLRYPPYGAWKDAAIKLLFH